MNEWMNIPNTYGLINCIHNTDLIAACKHGKRFLSALTWEIANDSLSLSATEANGGKRGESVGCARLNALPSQLWDSLHRPSVHTHLRIYFPCLHFKINFCGCWKEKQNTTKQLLKRESDGLSFWHMCPCLMATCPRSSHKRQHVGEFHNTRIQSNANTCEPGMWTSVNLVENNFCAENMYRSTQKCCELFVVQQRNYCHNINVMIDETFYLSVHLNFNRTAVEKERERGGLQTALRLY